VNTDRVISRGVNSNVPNVARIYDYFLGGKDNFAADRVAAAKIAEAVPEVVQAVRENREFIGRAVRFLAGAGIRQFIDVGTGLPTQENVHQVARRLIPDARVAYVDIDPVVVVHAEAILATDPGTIAVEADMREPATILRRVTERGFIDLAQPVAILMVAVLHFIPDLTEVTRIVATFREQMAAGSYLAITHATSGNLSEDNLARARQIYATSSAGSVTLRTYDQIEALFDGLELEEPGIVPAAQWRAASHEPQLAEPGVVQFPRLRSQEAASPATEGPAFVGGLARNSSGDRRFPGPGPA
jgi:hypothetical protein